MVDTPSETDDPLKTAEAEEEHSTRPADFRNRVVRVPIYRKDITRLFRGDIAVFERFPDDVQFVRTLHDPDRDVFYFVLRSKHFEPVEEGAKIPVHRPEVRLIDQDDETITIAEEPLRYHDFPE